MEKDPLQTLVKKSPGDFKEGYNIGFDNGKEKSDHEHELELVRHNEWLVKRIIEIEDVGAGKIDRGTIFLNGLEPWEAYLAALKDVAKALYGERY